MDIWQSTVEIVALKITGVKNMTEEKKEIQIVNDINGINGNQQTPSQPENGEGNNKKHINGKRIVYLLMALLSVCYTVWPVDAMPDVVPVAGQLDDALISLIPLIMGFFGFKDSKK
jgi:hypothetical protein